MPRFQQFLLFFGFYLIYGFAATTNKLLLINSYAQNAETLTEEEYRTWATELYSSS